MTSPVRKTFSTDTNLMLNENFNERPLTASDFQLNLFRLSKYQHQALYFTPYLTR